MFVSRFPLKSTHLVPKWMQRAPGRLQPPGSGLLAQLSNAGAHILLDNTTPLTDQDTEHKKKYKIQTQIKIQNLKYKNILLDSATPLTDQDIKHTIPHKLSSHMKRDTKHKMSPTVLQKILTISLPYNHNFFYGFPSVVPQLLLHNSQ